ncbi:MAG: hypothetical protein Kow0088_14280 [Anaerolineales bacterium]
MALVLLMLFTCLFPSPPLIGDLTESSRLTAQPIAKGLFAYLLFVISGTLLAIIGYIHNVRVT